MRAGIRGDDSTQDIQRVATLSPGSGNVPDPGLALSAAYHSANATVSLAWTDSNGLGKDRYRVERSDAHVGDGVFVELTRRPGVDTRLDDRPADVLYDLAAPGTEHRKKATRGATRGTGRRGLDGWG